MRAVTSRLRALWRRDLFRQSTIAFFAAAALATLVVALAFAIDAGENADTFNVNSLSEYQNDDANRSAAIIAGGIQGRNQGLDTAQNSLPNLLGGAESAGYLSGYDLSWNMIIWQAIPRAPLQGVAAAEGTQWIELLR